MILKLPLTEKTAKAVYPWCTGEKMTCYFSTKNSKGKQVKVLLFHGSPDPVENARIADKIRGIPCDFYLCCFGSHFPKEVREKHIMPRDTSVLVKIFLTAAGEYYLTVSDE